MSRLTISLPPAQQLVDGKLTGASDGATYPILDPATGQEIGVAPDSTDADVDAAIAAARRAFDESAWATDRDLRVRCLRQLHAALTEEAEEFKALTTAEVGMPGFMMTAAGFDVPVEGLRWVTDLLESYEFETDLGEAQPMGIPTRRTVRREPVGVVAAISPWNVPTQINLAKIGPALAAGCTVVLKPAPDTPWIAAELGRLVAERTDMPAGVLNVVTPRSNEVASQLTSDPRVDMVSFTGSTNTGRAITTWPRQRRAPPSRCASTPDRGARSPRGSWCRARSTTRPCSPPRTRWPRSAPPTPRTPRRSAAR